jgi:hypothetical protein
MTVCTPAILTAISGSEGGEENGNLRPGGRFTQVTTEGEAPLSPHVQEVGGGQLPPEAEFMNVQIC